SPGQGPAGADGDAVDGGGGSGDAPRPGVVPERAVGSVPGVPCGAGTSPAIPPRCGIAGGGLRPIGSTYTNPMTGATGRFRVKTTPHRHHAAGKRKIRRRLDRPITAPSPEPVITATNIHYDVAAKTRGIACGGIGAIQLLVRKLGLAEAIDERLHLLKLHLPYHESDHVLNLAYNALCNRSCLDDTELRRNDVVFPDALGADRIPAPTTAGDFCRRFTAEDVEILQDVFDQTRVRVWQQQPSAFFEEAILDVDGTLVATGAGC